MPSAAFMVCVQSTELHGVAGAGRAAHQLTHADGLHQRVATGRTRAALDHVVGVVEHRELPQILAELLELIGGQRTLVHVAGRAHVDAQVGVRAIQVVAAEHAMANHRGDVGARHAHHFEHVRVAAHFDQVRILALPGGLPLRPVDGLRHVVGAHLVGGADALRARGEIRVLEMAGRQRADHARGASFDIESGSAFVHHPCTGGRRAPDPRRPWKAAR